MIRNFVLMIFLGLSSLLYSQAWNVIEMIGSDEGINESLDAIHFTIDENLVIAGQFQSNLEIQGQSVIAQGEEDVYCGIYTQEGVLSHLFAIGGENEEWITDMLLDGKNDITFYGGYIGETKMGGINLQSHFSNQGLFLSQFDSDGQVKWAKSIDGRLLNISGEVIHDNNNNIIVTGYFLDSLKIENTFLEAGSDEGDLFVAKFDSEGNLIWAERAGLSGIIRSTTIQATSDNEIILAGHFKGAIQFNNDFLETQTATHDAFLAKISSSGHFLWGKQIGGVLEKEVQGLELLPNGNILLLGNYNGVMTDGNGWEIQSDGLDQDVFLLQLNPSGEIIFGKSYGGQGDDFPLDIHFNHDLIYVTGYFNGTTNWGEITITASDLFDPFLVILDGMGNTLNLQSISGNGIGISRNILSNSNGEFFLGGEFFGSLNLNGTTYNSKSYDAFWIKSTDLVHTKPIVQEKEWKVYPNPGNEFLVIHSEENISFYLSDILGQKIIPLKAGVNEIGHLDKGIYFISDAKRTRIKKWIKL